MIMMSDFVKNNIRMGLVCLFKFKSFDQFNPLEPPQILDIYSVVARGRNVSGDPAHQHQYITVG